MSIVENIQNVRSRMAAAANEAGRRAQDIKLIAVSKTVGIDRINEAIRAGICAIGENKVQELLAKRELLLPVEQHLIGELQTNKAKHVVGRVALIHSLERMSLAIEIDKISKKIGFAPEVLLQVNISGEETKGGLRENEVLPFLEQIEGLGFRIKGLMTVPPICAEDEARRYFARLRILAYEISQRGFENATMDELSMGMSGDFEAAIKEGATMVRVGSAIFGNRTYTQ